MPVTYNSIQKLQTVDDSSTSIVFNNIPSTYTDLVIWYSLKATVGDTYNNVRITFNNDTGTNYQHYVFYGIDVGLRYSDKQVTKSAIYDFFIIANDSNRTNQYGVGNIYIPRYAGNTKKKTSIDFGGGANKGNNVNVSGTGVIQGYHSGMWNLTNPITSITLSPGSGNFKQYSSATLYGIKNS